MSSRPFYISEGDGQPLVFQHGLTADSTQINQLLGGLPNIQLISMDCPGHGQSMMTDYYVPSFKQYANDVVALMEELSITNTVIGGLSMGAGISLNIALRFPEKVKALILLRPAWLDEPAPVNLSILARGASFLKKPNGIDTFKQDPILKRITKENSGAAQSLLGIFNENQQSHLDRVIMNMVHDRPITSLTQLKNNTVPCLILANENDPLHPFNFGEIIARQMASAKLVKITSRYIDPEGYRTQVRAEINKFLKEIEQGYEESVESK